MTPSELVSEGVDLKTSLLACPKAALAELLDHVENCKGELSRRAFRSVQPREKESQMPATEAPFTTLGTVALDVHVVPHVSGTDGSSGKIDVELLITPGGAAVNCGCFGPANGIPTVAVGVQAASWAGYTRDLVKTRRVDLLLAERKGTAQPAISILVPAGAGGETRIYTHRLPPITVAELTPGIRQALRSTTLLIVGPMACTMEVQQLLAQLPALAPKAFRAWLPHPSQIRDSSFFARLVKRFDYVQMNANESCLLPGALPDLEARAQRLSCLVGEANACAVTNGPGRGWLFCGGEKVAIDPPQVQATEDTACGDSLAGAFLIGWRLIGLPVQDALDYGVRAAAMTATQTGVSEPLRFRDDRRCA